MLTYNKNNGSCRAIPARFLIFGWFCPLMTIAGIPHMGFRKAQVHLGLSCGMQTKAPGWDKSSRRVDWERQWRVWLSRT